MVPQQYVLLAQQIMEILRLVHVNLVPVDHSLYPEPHANLVELSQNSMISIFLPQKQDAFPVQQDMKQILTPVNVTHVKKVNFPKWEAVVSLVHQELFPQKGPPNAILAPVDPLQT
jgi:hypothetical protein